VDDSDKHKLEGLLQARSEDLRQSRHGRRRRVVADAGPAREPAAAGRAQAAASARRCAECGADIPARRLRAMPRATRCLDCQRATERAATPS
jgi:RNA polymerase-binding transcription factor DksA